MRETSTMLTKDEFIDHLKKIEKESSENDHLDTVITILMVANELDALVRGMLTKIYDGRQLGELPPEATKTMDALTQRFFGHGPKGTHLQSLRHGAASGGGGGWRRGGAHPRKKRRPLKTETPP